MDAAVAIVRVALIEDKAAMRDEVARVLRRYPSRLSLVQAFPDGETFLAAQKTILADVVLVDLGLPGMSGYAVIRALAEGAPSIRTLALTIFEDEASVLRALQAGAFGYLLKDEPPERLVTAIEEAAAGEHPLSSRVTGFLLAKVTDSRPQVSLSAREQELAKCLGKGLTYAECAAEMGIAIGTLQEYVKRLYRKLDVNSSHEVREWVSRYAATR